MPSPCRVLILNERDPRHPRQGGAELHVSQIFGRLAARGYQVEQLSCGFAGGAEREVVDGILVRRLGRLHRYYPRAFWRCARETREARFDVVVECLNKVLFYSPLYSRAPVLALCHHLFGEVAFRQVPLPIATAVWCIERPLPWFYGRTPFVTISESSRQDLIQRGIPADAVQVSHCGIERPQADVDTSRARARRVAYLGRLEPYKQVDTLLRAVARLTPRFPDVELLVIGTGTAREALERLASQLGIAERTRFTGFVSDAERDQLLAGTRVCVCPSEKEGWGLTVIESNAAGTPVVAADAPGLRDSVREGETGFLAPVGDVGAFADRIGTLLADDALWLRVATAALEWSHRFDWEIAADEMAEAIEGARRRGRGAT